MNGRLPTPVGFKPVELRGFWTREQREYFVASLALQPNKDQDRAMKLWEKILARRLSKANGDKDE